MKKPDAVTTILYGVTSCAMVFSVKLRYFPEKYAFM